jgi:hypothetical protein
LARLAGNGGCDWRQLLLIQAALAVLRVIWRPEVLYEKASVLSLDRRT